VAVSVGDPDAGICLFGNINIAQELPVQDIRAEIGIVGVICAVRAYKDHFHTEPAGGVIGGFRQGCSASPCIYHVGVPGCSLYIQCFGKLLVLFRVSKEFVYMLFQAADAFRNFCS